MTNKTIHLIYFSPTGTTLKTLEAISKGIGDTIATMTDLTTAAEISPVLTENDIVLVGIPVYGGRLPQLAVERFKSIKGNRASVVPVVVYGNRHYDDALVELFDRCCEQGFRPVAAGAFIGEHSFSTPELPLSKGRPTAIDLEKAETFGRQISDKELTKDQVPGNRPYKPAMTLSGSATGVDPTICTKCGKCLEVCPTQGMTQTEHAAEADPDNCIWCMACLRICPVNARSITHETVKGAVQKLNTLCSEPREPETFIA